MNLEHYVSRLHLELARWIQKKKKKRAHTVKIELKMSVILTDNVLEENLLVLDFFFFFQCKVYF